MTSHKPEPIISTRVKEWKELLSNNRTTDSCRTEMQAPELSAMSQDAHSGVVDARLIKYSTLR